MTQRAVNPRRTSAILLTLFTIVSSTIAAAPAITPACAIPADYSTKYACQITGEYTYFVHVVGDTRATTTALAAAYGLTAIFVIDSPPANFFYARLKPPTGSCTAM